MIDTINTICKDIAPGLGLQESLVRKVYAHYWKTVKKSVASGQHTSIWLKSIGTLAVSRTKVRKHIQKLIWRIRDLKAGRLTLETRKTRQQMMQEAVDDLRLMCARRNEIAIAYKANDERLQQRYATKNTGCVGQSLPNTTGTNEQVLLSSQGDGPEEIGSV